MISRVLNVLSLDPGEINPRFVEHSDPLRNYQSYVGYLLQNTCSAATRITATAPLYKTRHLGPVAQRYGQTLVLLDHFQ